MRIVTFYTPEYAGELAEWTRHVMPLPWEHKAYPLPTKGSWRGNCGLKHRFLLDVLDETQDSVMWIDIDARVRGPLPIVPMLEAASDFAAWFIPWDQMNPNHRPGGPKTQNDGISSGTMFFNNTAVAREFLGRWRDADVGQYIWEQIVLGEVWHFQRPPALRTYRLPQAYYKVFDKDWKRGEKGPIEIEHFQASRRLRRKVGR